jgi:hypothetical protein
MAFKPRKSYKRKSNKPRTTRRRLGGVGSGRRAGKIAGSIASAIVPRAYDAGRKVYSKYVGKRYYNNAQRRALSSANLSASDNITALLPTIIGTPREPSFQEKVLKASVAPILYKRSYQWSSECLGGRKAWFHMELNHNSNDIGEDVNATYRPNLSSDTSTADGQLTGAGQADRQRFYVDYMSSKLQFMNSGTNALTGKIHLFAYKRDCATDYNGVPINPVNMMMFYSSFAHPIVATGQEFTVGNGWVFDTATSNYAYNGNYNMPGSSLNTSGVCAFTDLALTPSSAHIKKDLSYWFKLVKTDSFSLKAGQQLNKVYKFHDLKEIARESLSYQKIEGVSFSLCVEFQGQIVGAIDTANLVSTGSAQLSCIRDDLRVLGMKNWIKPKVFMKTNPLSTILKANQTIINPDSGTVLNGFSDDA